MAENTVCSWCGKVSLVPLTTYKITTPGGKVNEIPLCSSCNLDRLRSTVD
jgi:hypothetical protein